MTDPASRIAYLEAVVRYAENDLANARDALNDFKDSAECNIYSTREEAEDDLTDKLCERASDDCEGSYNVGLDEYVVFCTIAGKKHKATLHCEYNRHDKRYYFLDGHKLVISAVDE